MSPHGTFDLTDMCVLNFKSRKIPISALIPAAHSHTFRDSDSGAYTSNGSPRKGEEGAQRASIATPRTHAPHHVARENHRRHMLDASADELTPTGSAPRARTSQRCRRRCRAAGRALSCGRISAPVGLEEMVNASPNWIGRSPDWRPSAITAGGRHELDLAVLMKSSPGINCAPLESFRGRRRRREPMRMHLHIARISRTNYLYRFRVCACWRIRNTTQTHDRLVHGEGLVPYRKRRFHMDVMDHSRQCPALLWGAGQGNCAPACIGRQTCGPSARPRREVRVMAMLPGC